MGIGDWELVAMRHGGLLALVMVGSLLAITPPAHAQGRDNLLNGAVIGGVIGAGAGIAFTHAVRDSDLSAGQYAYGALVIGGIGAGIGLAVDALLARTSPLQNPPRRVVLIPTARRGVKAVAVGVRWR